MYALKVICFFDNSGWKRMKILKSASTKIAVQGKGHWAQDWLNPQERICTMHMRTKLLE